MFAKRVFFIAGIVGLIEILPLFFLERFVDQQSPPAVNHPEWYYGFCCVTLVFQLIFLLISTDPPRYRPLMPLAVLEKLPYVVAIAILFSIGRVSANFLGGPAIDFVFGVLFIIAWRKTPTISHH